MTRIVDRISKPYGEIVAATEGRSKLKDSKREINDSTSTSERKRKRGTKSKFRTAITFVALFVLGGLVGLGWSPIIGFFGIDFGRVDVSLWVLIPGLVLAPIFVLAFHEAGHVIAGKLVGFRFTLFIVGPFKIYSTESGIRFGLNRSLMLAGGLGGAAPTDSRNLTRRMTTYVAGGPVASLLLAVTAFGLLFVLPASIGILLSIVALISFMIGLVTLIPNKSGGLVSDGARLLMLRRGGPEAERWCAIAALGGASMAGERPRDWDEGMIEKSLSQDDGSLDATGAASMAHYRALDLGKKDEAEILLERALSAGNVPEMVRSQVLLEAAFFQAHFHQDAREARILSSEAQPGKVLEKHLPAQAESAILLAEGDNKEAKEKAREALKAIGRSFSAGTAKLQREWLEEIVATSGHRAARTRGEKEGS